MHGIARHSIIFQRADAGPCAICSKPVEHGPIGWHDTKGALYDACFIEEHRIVFLAELQGSREHLGGPDV